MSPLLEVVGLVVARGGRRMVGPVSAAFAGGSFVGIIGPNAAGKTTLLKTLAGLLEPQEGLVSFDGRPVGAWDSRRRACRIGFLPQERECAWPLSVERVVSLGRLPRNGSGDGPAAVEAALEACEIEGLRGRRMDELSGGEKARVLLARVLAGEPEVILADEPVSGLDPGHAMRILDVLKSRTRAGVLVIAVVHELSLAARGCDRLLLLKDGVCVADGDPRAVLTAETLASAFGIEARTFEQDGHLGVLPLEVRP